MIKHSIKLNFILLCIISVGILSAATDTSSIKTDSSNSKVKTLLSNWNLDLRADMNFQAYKPYLKESFAIDEKADDYGGNWFGALVDPRNAYEWNKIKPFFNYQQKVSYKNSFMLLMDIPIYRDMMSWYDHSGGGNWVLDVTDFDINVIYNAWMQYEKEWFKLKLGRFDHNLGFSKDRSVILSGSPWEDGVLAEINFPKAKYGLYIASLNPYLIGGVNSKDYPEGSEPDIQHNRSVLNARGLIYDEPYKSLVSHSIVVEYSHWGVGLYENTVIGGKSLDFRDFSPLAVWHNSYGNGYYNNSGYFEMMLRWDFFGRVYFQVGADDISNPVGTEGFPSLWQVLGGWEYEKKVRQHQFLARVEYIFSSPYYGNAEVPLLYQTSRKTYRSNYREQFVEDPPFVDTYIVDYPLNYWRGMNLKDLWFDFKYYNSNLKLGVDMTLGWLRQGEKSYYDDYWKSLSERNQGFYGVVEEEINFEILATYQAFKWAEIYLGFGDVQVYNEDHIAGNHNNVFTWNFGLSFSLD